MQDRIFYAVCFRFAVGVLLRSFVVVDFYFSIFVLVLSFFILLLSHFTKLKWGIISAVFIFTFSLGILRFHLEDKKVREIRGENFTGIIVDEPDIRENNQKLTVETGEAKVLATTNFDEEYKYGDKINFSGKLEKPENFITDQGKEFDYANYLRKDRIFYLSSYPDIEILSHGNGGRIREVLFAVKEKLLEKMNLAIAPPESIL